MSIDILQLGRAIKQAQYRQHRALDSRMAEIGTTLVQWDALRAIRRTPGESAHALALATFQTDQAFGTLANRLAAQGLIERRAGHGRRIEHHLTQAGEDILAAGGVAAQEVLSSLFSSLSEGERTHLLGLLSRLINAES